MSSVNLSILARNKLLRGLSSEQVAQFALHLASERFPEGGLIIMEGLPGEKVYLLTEGRVQVQKRLSGAEDVQIAVVEAGGFFGEMSLFLDSSGRSASIRAMSPVKTYSLQKEELSRLLTVFPEILKNIISNIVSDLQASNGRLVDALRGERDELEARVAERTRQLEKLTSRIERELAVAQNIQRNLLPEKEMKFPGVLVRTEYLPCDELSGDIMGVFPVDEARIGLYGGDVCGHGIYAAMIMSYVKKLIEISVKRVLLNRQFVVKPPGAVLSAINQSFIAEISQGDPEIYLTLFLAVLDLRDGRFDYSSAGIHLPPLICSNGTVSSLFDASDFSIGHVRDHQYETFRAVLCPGDGFFFVSDGVVEARRDDEIFGVARLKEEASRSLALSAEPDLGKIVDSVKHFLGPEKPEDDMCFLYLRRDLP